MNQKESIKKIASIRKNKPIELPKEAGIYAFWWIGDRQELLRSNTVAQKVGPKGQGDVTVTYEDWWPSNLCYPCLYVGRSTNIRQRFSQHIHWGSEGRLPYIPGTNNKPKRKYTSCQLRYGIEHIFKNHKNPMNIIDNKVGFSFCTISRVECRFYKESLLIGKWKPWFNVDSER